MAEVAQSLPLPRSLLTHIPESIRRELLPRYEALVHRARASKPEPESVSEQELVRELTVLLVDVLERLGSYALTYLRSDVQGQLDELIRDELRSADATRKLALRHLQRSVEVAGKIIELGGEVLRSLPDAALEQAIGLERSAWRVDLEGQLGDDDFYGFLAWWLSLCVGLECTLGDLGDLTYWSRRAIEGSRKVEASLPRTASDVRAVGLLLRAQWAWQDWDEGDIEDEIGAWQELSK